MLDETMDVEGKIKIFAEYVTWIRDLDRIVDELFENPAAREVMEEIAPVFMKVMNKIVLNSLINSLCRITEPAETHGNQNFTVQHVVGELRWTEGRHITAQQILKRCDDFHQLLKEGRNKISAHNDWKTILTKREYPLPPDLSKRVIEQLLCLIMHAYEEYGSGLDGHVSLGVEGDVLDFRKALANSLVYERTLSDRRLPQDLQLDMRRWRSDWVLRMNSHEPTTQYGDVVFGDLRIGE